MFDEKWNQRFMNLAREVSTWSKDPSSQVGCVIVDDNKRILGTGYNGFPSRIEDDSRLETKEEKYPIIIHSEMNCLLTCLNNGVSVKNSTIFVYKHPICPNCAKHLIQAGLKSVVIKKVVGLNNWNEDWKLSSKLFTEAGISVLELD